MLRRGLRVAGHEVTVVSTAAEARSAWHVGTFGVVLLDIMLPDGDGLDLLAERRASGDTTPVVLLTAREEAELEERVATAGASGYLAMPFAYADLVAGIERAVRAPSEG